MAPERWREIEALYQAALERNEEEQRTLLAQAEPEVRREVEAMLANADAASLLNHNAWEIEQAQTGQRPLGAGLQIGQYTIESAIGAGGMGVVYGLRTLSSTGLSQSSFYPTNSRTQPHEAASSGKLRRRLL